MVAQKVYLPNCINNEAKIFHLNLCKRNIRILLVGIKYSMHELVCEYINYCALSFDMGKISVHDKIVNKNL